MYDRYHLIPTIYQDPFLNEVGETLSSISTPDLRLEQNKLLS